MKKFSLLIKEDTNEQKVHTLLLLVIVVSACDLWNCSSHPASMKGTNLRVSCYAKYERTENRRNIGHYLAELINLGDTLLQNFLLIELKFSFIVKAAELVFPTTCNRKKKTYLI